MKKLLKISVFSITGIFVAFLLYANAEPRPLHAYAPATGILFYELETDPTKAFSLETKIEKMEGVTACSYSPETTRMCILFNPENCTEEQLKGLLKKENIKFKFSEIEGESGPECPIPHGYIQKFEQLKYALNFR